VLYKFTFDIDIDKLGILPARAVNLILSKFGTIGDLTRMFLKSEFRNNPSTNFHPDGDKAYRCT